MEDRLKTLRSLSNLRVTVHKERNQSVFEFFLGEDVVKTCFTYWKAKCFAEGVKLGRSLGNTHKEHNSP